MLLLWGGPKAAKSRPKRGWSKKKAKVVQQTARKEEKPEKLLRKDVRVARLPPPRWKERRITPQKQGPLARPQKLPRPNQKLLARRAANPSPAKLRTKIAKKIPPSKKPAPKRRIQPRAFVPIRPVRKKTRPTKQSETIPFYPEAATRRQRSRCLPWGRAVETSQKPAVCRAAGNRGKK